MSRSNKLTLSTSKRSIIYTKCHAQSWFINIYKRYSLRVYRICYCFPDINIWYTHNSNNISSFSFLYFKFLQTLVSIKFTNLSLLNITIFSTYSNILTLRNTTTFNPTYSNSSYIVIVVNTWNKHLHRFVWMNFWSTDIFNYCFKNRCHICSWSI